MSSTGFGICYYDEKETRVILRNKKSIKKLFKKDNITVKVDRNDNKEGNIESMVVTVYNDKPKYTNMMRKYIEKLVANKMK